MYATQYQRYQLPVDATTDYHRFPMRPYQFPSQYLPPYTDLRDWMTPVKNQEQTDACAANAFAGAIEYIFKRRTGKDIAVSRLFIYYNGRMIQQQSCDLTDGGSSKRAIALGLRKFGVCEEFVWPYERNYLDQTPPPNAYEAANQITVVVLKVPRNLIAMKTCLANGVPFLIGIKLLSRATDEARYNGGYISTPNANDPEIPQAVSHAVLVVGYDDRTGHFIARNSWGRDWGVDGYCYIPYAYMLERCLVNFTDGVWAIPDVVQRRGHSPTVRQMVVPGHNRDARYRYRYRYYPPCCYPSYFMY